MLSLHDQNRGPWILLHVALDKGRFNMTVCGRYSNNANTREVLFVNGFESLNLFQ
jgi:hypothetical protein